MGKGPGSLQFQRVFPRRDVDLETVFPLGATRVPASRCTSAALPEVLLVKVELHGTSTMSGVSEPDLVGTIDRQFQIVLDENGALSTEGDHGPAVGVLFGIGKGLGIASIVGIARDLDGLPASSCLSLAFRQVKRGPRAWSTTTKAAEVRQWDVMSELPVPCPVLRNSF